MVQKSMRLDKIYYALTNLFCPHLQATCQANLASQLIHERALKHSHGVPPVKHKEKDTSRRATLDWEVNC